MSVNATMGVSVAVSLFVDGVESVNERRVETRTRVRGFVAVSVRAVVWTTSSALDAIVRVRVRVCAAAAAAASGPDPHIASCEFKRSLSWSRAAAEVKEEKSDEAAYRSAVDAHVDGVGVAMDGGRTTSVAASCVRARI